MIIDSRYKVVSELGSGLWATVYKVKDIRSNRLFALKLFQNIGTDVLYEKFSAEQMHHITRIQHPNLIHVLDFGSYEGHIYYLSEYFQGTTLRDFRLKAANLELLYEIITQICYALSALHSQKIIHQNLKPENVIYSVQNNQPDVKIMDYGFTKIDFEKKQQQISSSLPYIAPEIYLDRNPVNESDFYSLGVILYKLATGTLPYTVDQITSFIAGDSYNLLPKFPRELNPDIPDGLEKMILKMLEKNPEDRFRNNEEIISYLNKIQIRQFPFSRKWSIVNNIKFSDYLVREDYAHQLLEYVPIMEEGNGKIIVITAGRGLGKTGALQLFRYHLLTDKYFIFDYECSPQHKDPFFALIKEFYRYIKNNEKLRKDLANISEKFRKYLFESEEMATREEQTREDLSLDFQSASSFIFDLALEKPLIFMIRSGEYLDDEVIDFLNYLSGELTRQPILIILSVNDPRKIEGLIHPVRLKIEALDLDQTRRYVEKLLQTLPPDRFLDQLWQRSNGNPLFIELILIDLTQSRKIWKNNRFDFGYNLEKYELPEEIIHFIYLRMAHLSENGYLYLRKLASVFTPLSKELIKYVLGIDDKELFFLLKDGTDNELLTRRDDYYIFTYREAVERFRNESLHREQKEIARRILKYFEDKLITRISILGGVIRHAYQVQDMLAVRKYRLKKVSLYAEKGQQVEAFREMCEVVQLDFLTQNKLQPGDFIHDLLLLADKAEWGTIDMVPGKLAELVRKMENRSEKHLLIGIFYLLQEKLRLALIRFRQAYEQAISGRQRVYLLLKMGEIYFAQNDLVNLGNCISELEKLQLTPELELSLISQKALYLGSSGKLTEAINLIEEYLPRIRTQNDDNFFIRLGTLHNNLAFLYHQKRLLDEAEKNFHIARKIWEKINYKRKLAVVYNNLGDVALVQGYTRTALEHFEKALAVCNEINCKKIKVLSLLNFGEAYIKIGDFQQAEKYLNSAYEMSNSFENKPFHEPIINNQAIAKSKVNHFGYYINFIREQAPELIAGRINKITPLTKTYFYYLYNIGDYDKAEKILLKHKNLFLDSNEHEFYYQVKGFLTIRRQEFEEGLKIVEQAFKLSQQNRSFYAQTINYIRFAECYQGTGDFEKAIEMCNQAENIALQNNFNYWLRVARLRRIKAQLSGSNISLRILIRELLEILCYVKQRNLFLLEMEVYEMLIQIYNHLQIIRKARIYFTSYRKSIESMARGLNQQDEKIFLQSAQYHISDYRQFRTIDIAPRGFQVTANWQEELYDILKIKENYRIKFFIDKTIINLLSPNLYAIVLSNEIQNQAAPYLQHNISVVKLYSAKYLNLIQKSIEENHLISRRLDSCNTLFVPLRIKTAKVGCLILADKGELPFQEFELDILQNLRLHLSSILIRIREFSELNKDMELMTKLIEINQKFFSNLNLEKLEQEIVSFVLDFVNGKRGFLIKRDKYQNYVYKVALDDSKHFLRNFTFISKSIVSEVQKNKLPLFIHNARDDDTLRNSLEFNADRLSIYCAPIMLDGEVYGLLYIDNYNSSDGKMQINKEFMRLLLIQIGVSLKNAQQYEMLKARNREISTLDNLKNDFINIVSHELKTPLVTLKGYIDRLSRTGLSEEARKIIVSVEKSVDKLYLTTNDIIDHNRYILVNELDKSPVALNKIMQVMVEEARQISGNRHMQIRLELEPGLPELNLNWEAFQLMLRNIMLNAIRFTKDFGTIVLGARRSAFQQEEVNNRESVVIYVQDNGIGIPQNELERVFQKFYELGELYAHSSGSVEFKSSGLGLGLSTAGLIANLHDGKIWLNSREGEGTTVFISLPLPGNDEEVE